jgi:amino acid transporter
VFSVISFAMSGAEAAGLMAGEVRQPEKTVAPAVLAATSFASMFYIACTVALLVVLKQTSISELHGVADVGLAAGQFLHASWLPPVIAVFVLMNAVGAFGGWGSAVSRLPYAAGVDHLLPSAFSRVHPRWHTPYVSILVLGAAASLLLILVQIGDTFKAAINAMVSLMVIAGYIPYLYIFASAWKAGKRLAAICGEFATCITLACSFVPEPDSKVWLFEFKIVMGTIAVIGIAGLLYRRNKRV